MKQVCHDLLVGARHVVPLLFAYLLISTTPTHAQADPLESMTLEQKVAQMLIVNLFGSQLNAPGKAFLQQWQPGGVVLIGENTGTPEAVAGLVNQYQQTITD